VLVPAQRINDQSRDGVRVGDSGLFRKVEHGKHHLHRIRRRPSTTAYRCSVHVEGGRIERLVDCVTVELCHIDGQPNGMKVFPYCRVPERV
jgi:hypothetical protein